MKITIIVPVDIRQIFLDVYRRELQKLINHPAFDMEVSVHTTVTVLQMQSFVPVNNETMSMSSYQFMGLHTRRFKV